MARKMQVRATEYRVYLDDFPVQDFEPGTGEKRWKDEEKTVPKMTTECRAVELPLDANIELPPEAEGGTIYRLASIPLDRALTRSQRSARGEAGEAIFETVSDGITGWDNAADSEGKDVPYSKEFVRFLPFEEASAIAQFLMEKILPGSTEQDQKNV